MEQDNQSSNVNTETRNVQFLLCPRPLFPGSEFEVSFGAHDARMFYELEHTGTNIFVSLVKENTTESSLETDSFHEVGTLAKVDFLKKGANGDAVFRLVGIERAKLDPSVPLSGDNNSFEVAVKPYPYKNLERQDKEPYLIAQAKVLFEQFEKYNTLIEGETNPTLARFIEDSPLPSQIANMIEQSLVKIPDFPSKKRQELLEMDSLRDRLQALTLIVEDAIQQANLTKDLQKKTQDRMNPRQEAEALRERIRTAEIRLAELGEGPQNGNETANLAIRLKDAGLSPDMSARMDKELNRMKRLNEESAEYNIARTYLDFVAELPWNKSSTLNNDIDLASDILDSEHFGMKEPKDVILDFLAVKILNPDAKAPILCFDGPPGVGKTTLGQSIADAMGVPFAVVSLAGLKEESELRGHRRTFVGAMCGRILRAIKDSGSNDPVLMLDEIDKIGSDFKGDPSAILLEILDPKQNKKFQDHYLGEPFDLSRVTFITTSNYLQNVSAPLLDRMQLINVEGYIESEKLPILKNYILPRQIKDKGLTGKISVDDGAMKDIIHYYTREAGVRKLEERVGSLCSRVARKIVQGKAETPVKITSENLEEYLSVHPVFNNVSMNVDEVGVMNGLFYTPAGGGILSIEATIEDGTGQITSTGNLKEVIKESIEVGKHLIRSNMKRFGISEDRAEELKKKDIHLHFPEGAIPKDGPSAGIAITAALLSIMTGRKIRKNVAATGEMTTRSKALPIGGLKEKIEGARLAGIDKVITSVANKPDVEKLPAVLRESVDIVLVENMDEALEHIFADAVSENSLAVPDTCAIPAQRARVHEQHRTLQ